MRDVFSMLSTLCPVKIWSVFNFVRVREMCCFGVDFCEIQIHSKRRNRLKNEQIEKLVFAYANASIITMKRKERDYIELIKSHEDD